MEKAPKPSAASTTWFGRRETSMNLTKKAYPPLPANTSTGAGRRVGITRTEGEKKKRKYSHGPRCKDTATWTQALMPRLKLLLVVLCNQFLYVSQFIVEIFTSVLLFTVFWI